MKKGNTFNTQDQVDDWVNTSFCPIAQHFVLKLSASLLPNIPLTLERLQQFIVDFTWHQSHTVSCRKYTAFLKHSILSFPLKISGFIVKLFNFPYTVPRENYELVLSTSLCLSSIIWFIISQIVLQGSKLWRDSN